VPIYIPSSILTNQVAVYVEGLTFPLWILGPEEERTGELRKFYAEMAAAWAYWIWQSSRWLSRITGPQSAGKPLIIELLFADKQVWSEMPSTSVARQAHELISATSDPNLRRVLLTFQPGASSLFVGADNHGERECLKIVLRGICDVLGISDKIPDSQVSALVDDVAPLGLKKMLLLFNLNHLPQLDPRDIQTTGVSKRATSMMCWII
jgi:hypothetical protein